MAIKLLMELFMENFKKRAIELVLGLAITEEKMPSVIPYEAAKTACSQSEKKYFRRRIGGKKKKYAKVLADLLVALEKEKRANVHNIMIIKDGEVICEASHPGYDVNTFHLAHSMSKTVTGLAIGLLIDEGKLSLDTPIVDIFPEYTYRDERFPEITVEHLLTMRSGVPFSELGTVTESHWTEAYFSSILNFKPGDEFEYNSINSYILAEAVARLSGESLTEYLDERVFSPLGITNYFWEKGPELIEKGGFGLYMSCESFAKIGVLLLNGGVFEGKRIISAEWIKASTSLQAIVPEEKGSFNYGYHIWVSRASSSFCLNGMCGQNVWICPTNNIVVSVNAGNNELFQDSPALEIILRYLSTLPTDEKLPTYRDLRVLKYIQKHFFEGRHWIRPAQVKRGISYFLGLRDRRPIDPLWNDVLGIYSFPDNNTGVLPLFVRTMQNNFLGGIEYFELRREEEELIFVSHEGGVGYELPIGLYDYAESIVDFDGEHYIVRAFGEAMEDEDRNPVYKIELLFPELPNTRMIKITKTPTGIRVRMSENPNHKIADSFIATMSTGGTIGFAMGILEKRAGEDFIERKLRDVFNPELFGIDTRISGWENIIAAENQAIAERHERSGKLIKTMVNKFITEKEPPKPKPQTKSFLQRAIGAIMARKHKKTAIKVKEYTEVDVTVSETAPVLDEPNKSLSADEVEFVTVINDDGELSVVRAEDEGAK